MIGQLNRKVQDFRTFAVCVRAEIPKMPSASLEILHKPLKVSRTVKLFIDLQAILQRGKNLFGIGIHLGDGSIEFRTLRENPPDEVHFDAVARACIIQSFVYVYIELSQGPSDEHGRKVEKHLDDAHHPVVFHRAAFLDPDAA